MGGQATKWAGVWVDGLGEQVPTWGAMQYCVKSFETLRCVSGWVGICGWAPWGMTIKRMEMWVPIGLQEQIETIQSFVHMIRYQQKDLPASIFKQFDFQVEPYLIKLG